MPLAQNNFYAKVAYLGMAYTGILQKHWVFPGGSDGKQSACNAGDPGSIPGKADPLAKGMTTYSSILVWRIPWTEEPGGIQSMGSQRIGHD